ncbi:MAG: Na+ dependent nucleoside transporter domain protein [Planctomycetota bacterium]|nr:Na+ dependent nucleoside transporter domain protein [Planctomycetota bacterium]
MQPNIIHPTSPPQASSSNSLRIVLLCAVVALTVTAYLLAPQIGTRGQAVFGIVAFLTLASAMSTNLRAVNLKTIGWGIALQIALAVGVTQFTWVQSLFQLIGSGIKVLIDCSDKGGEFVFGSLSKVDGPAGFVFAFKALPPIIFVSAFFSVLYYLGVLQLVVKAFAWVMQFFMGTSGAETLSVSANVFMGQTEAPLIVKPFVPRMTQSELLTMMASGMAHISGGMMAVYISYGADPVAILSTCVMACPCSLYLAKLVVPETEVPETLVASKIVVPTMHENAIDAAASGVKDGLMLALNVAAMLIGFLAFIALFDSLISGIKPLLLSLGLTTESLAWIPNDLTLSRILGTIFQPVAMLIGVPINETPQVGSLLGIKLAANEHVAYVTLTKDPAYADLSERARLLSVYALTGFANFSSIGIQLGGIGALAPERRADLAKLGLKALFVGFLATILNASVAGLLIR